MHSLYKCHRKNVYHIDYFESITGYVWLWYLYSNLRFVTRLLHNRFLLVCPLHLKIVNIMASVT